MRTTLHYCFSLIYCTLLLFTSCKKKTESVTVAPPVRVTVEVVSTGSESISAREYSGTVVAAETTVLSFSVGGTVQSLNANVGQKVSKGQILGRIEAGDYVNARNIAYAQLAEARDGYERLKKLHEANALPAVKWVEMEQKLKQAQNAAEIADRTLNDAVLHSPAAGTISQKFVEPGQTVIPAQPIYELVSTSDLDVEISLSENEIGDVTPGMPAMVRFDTPGAGRLEGKVKNKAVVADPLTRGYTVKISVPANRHILPGMIANVSFPVAKEAQDTVFHGVTLPSGAVLLDFDNSRFVWVVKNNKAERRFVTADELVANGIYVKSGLVPGDTVIVEGMQKIGTGSEVTTILNK